MAWVHRTWRPPLRGRRHLTRGVRERLALAALLLGVAAGPRSCARRHNMPVVATEPGGRHLDVITDLLQAGRPAAAQLRCARWQAELSEVEREMCALASWPSTARRAWPDTQLAELARVDEALAAHVAHRDGAKAIQSANDPDRAVAVARRYPDHRDAWLLVERFPERFLRVSVDGDEPAVEIEPRVALPTQPRAVWSVRVGPEVLPWPEAARRHVADQGLPPEAWEVVQGWGRTATPCPVPGADWTLGATVTLGSSSLFRPLAGAEGCPAQPTWLVFRAGELAAVSMSPDLTLEIPTGGMSWLRVDGAGTRVPLSGRPGAPVASLGELHQRVGTLWLFTPTTGALPYYTPRAPSPHAVPLLATGPPATATGWTFRATADANVVASPSLGVEEWTLPPGDVQALSPILAYVLDLHAEAATSLPSLPPVPGGVPPKGSIASPPTAMRVSDTNALASELAALGLPVRIERAWQTPLRARRLRETWMVQGKLEVDGRWARVRGIVDGPCADLSCRVYLWEAAAPSAPYGFVWLDRPYVGWRGPEGAELLHFDARGLQREVWLASD